MRLACSPRPWPLPSPAPRRPGWIRSLRQGRSWLFPIAEVFVNGIPRMPGAERLMQRVGHLPAIPPKAAPHVRIGSGFPYESLQEISNLAHSSYLSSIQRPGARAGVGSGWVSCWESWRSLPACRTCMGKQLMPKPIPVNQQVTPRSTSSYRGPLEMKRSSRTGSALAPVASSRRQRAMPSRRKYCSKVDCRLVIIFDTMCSYCGCRSLARERNGKKGFGYHQVGSINSQVVSFLILLRWLR